MEMEEKRQVIQDGLNKRKSKRKQAIAEAEHEALTMQMIGIVNENARNAEIKKQAMLAERKMRNFISKRTTALKQSSNKITIELWATAAVSIVPIMAYVTDIINLWMLIVASAALILYAAFNAYKLIRNAREITNLNKGSVVND